MDPMIRTVYYLMFGLAVPNGDGDAVAALYCAYDVVSERPSLTKALIEVLREK